MGIVWFWRRQIRCRFYARLFMRSKSRRCGELNTVYAGNQFFRSLEALLYPFVHFV